MNEPDSRPQTLGNQRPPSVKTRTTSLVVRVFNGASAQRAARHGGQRLAVTGSPPLRWVLRRDAGACAATCGSAGDRFRRR